MLAYYLAMKINALYIEGLYKSQPWHLFSLYALNQITVNMIRESEVKYHISHDIPALAVQLSYIKDDNDVYRAIDCLTDYTKTAIRENNLHEVEECFQTACHLLREGNRLIQLAIENTFVYSVSRLLEISIGVAQSVRELFLDNFKKEYAKQINSKNP